MILITSNSGSSRWREVEYHQRLRRHTHLRANSSSTRPKKRTRLSGRGNKSCHTMNGNESHEDETKTCREATSTDFSPRVNQAYTPLVYARPHKRLANRVSGMRNDNKAGHTRLSRMESVSTPSLLAAAVAHLSSNVARLRFR